MQIITDATLGRRDWTYNALDCAVTAEIHDTLMRRIQGHEVPGAEAVYAFERALEGPALAMQIRGLRVDITARREALAELKADAAERRKEMDRFYAATREADKARLQSLIPAAEAALVVAVGRGPRNAARKEIRRLGKEIIGCDGFKWTKKSIAPGTKQLQDLFFRYMGIPEMRNKDGRVSCDKEVLERLKKRYPQTAPLVELVQTARDEAKQIESMQTGLSPDGRMRSHYSVGQTNEARWSSTKDVYKDGMNLQNVNNRLRVAFIPDPGYTFLSVDLKQADSHNIAYMARDEAYIAAHEKGNVHVDAARIFWPDLDYTGDDVKDKAMLERTPASWVAQPAPAPGQKAVFSLYLYSKKNQHSLNFILTPKGLARQLGCKEKLATQFYESYFSRYPNILRFHEEVKENIRKFGMLVTPMGRPRPFFGRYWDMGTVRQGVAFLAAAMTSDIIKIGMLRVWRQLDPHLVQLLTDEHDGMMMQVKTERLDEAKREVARLCRVEVPVHGRIMVVPAEIKSGRNWKDLT